MYNIKILRGTIFCPPIKYTRDFVNSLVGVVDDYVPILVRDNNALPIMPTWQLISPDEKDYLAFNGDKIDLIRIVNSIMDDFSLTAFTERCKAVFGKILKVTGNLCTRIALAPTVIITENGNKPTSLYSKIYNINAFQGTPLATSSLSQVFRIDKSIEGKDVKINLVANFHPENEMVNNDGVNQLKEYYLCDFDVNTMVNPNYKFNVAGVNDFFDIAPDCFKLFYSLYLSE